MHEIMIILKKVQLLMFGNVSYKPVKKRPKVPPTGLKCNCLFKYYKT